MNRRYRRAVERANRLHTRETLYKHSHKLTPQTCALWVPDAQGYVAEFCPHSFRVVEFANLARHYDENEAASAALAFREVTGLCVAVRPVYPQHGSL
jgi:hypothetical protein